MFFSLFPYTLNKNHITRVTYLGLSQWTVKCFCLSDKSFYVKSQGINKNMCLMPLNVGIGKKLKEWDQTPSDSFSQVLADELYWNANVSTGFYFYTGARAPYASLSINLYFHFSTSTNDTDDLSRIWLRSEMWSGR